MARRPGTAQKLQRQSLEAQANKASGYDDELRLLIGYFEDAEEATQTSRKTAERDRDYYDNKQLTAKELKVLAKRGQPDIIINRVQTKVNYLLGYEASQRTDPKGYPRTPQDEDAAAACSDSLNYLREKLSLSQVFSQGWENMLIEGFAGAELTVAPDDKGDADIGGGHVHWDRLFYDPHAREHDFADARYLGMVVWLDQEEALRRWPSGEEAIAKSIADDAGKTYDDRPSWKQWAISGTRKRVRIVQMYHKKGEDWFWCIFTKGGKLDSGEVPYRDEDNKSLCPLIMQSAFVDRDNARYGFVRALIGPQDEINKRRSKMLHQSMMRQVVMEHGAFDEKSNDVDRVREELAKPDGLIVLNPGGKEKFDVLDNTSQFQHQAELLAHATNEMNLMGPNAVMQGKGERGASGRAKLVDQQGGQIEIYRLIDRHNHFKRRVYKLLWAMVRQYWTAQKWIRVTDDERNVRFVGLNKPVTLAEDLIAQAVKDGVPEQEAQAQLEQQVQVNPMLAQQLQQVVRMENVPAQMNMDIILEEVPDAANVQQEQFEILAQLAQAGIQFPPAVYIKSSALRDKSALLDELEKAQSDPQNQAIGQAQMDKLAAEIEKLRADIDKVKADTVKTLADADAVDKQFGTVIDPAIIQPGQAGGGWGGDGGAPAGVGPSGMPPPPLGPDGSPGPPGGPQGPSPMMGGMHQMPDGSMMADDDMMGGSAGYPMPVDPYAQPNLPPPQVPVEFNPLAGAP